MEDNLLLLTTKNNARRYVRGVDLMRVPYFRDMQELCGSIICPITAQTLDMLMMPDDNQRHMLVAGEHIAKLIIRTNEHIDLPGGLIDNISIHVENDLPYKICFGENSIYLINAALRNSDGSIIIPHIPPSCSSIMILSAKSIYMRIDISYRTLVWPISRILPDYMYRHWQGTSECFIDIPAGYSLVEINFITSVPVKCVSLSIHGHTLCFKQCQFIVGLPQLYGYAPSDDLCRGFIRFGFDRWGGLSGIHHNAVFRVCAHHNNNKSPVALNVNCIFRQTIAVEHYTDLHNDTTPELCREELQFLGIDRVPLSRQYSEYFPGIIQDLDILALEHSVVSSTNMYVRMGDVTTNPYISTSDDIPKKCRINMWYLDDDHDAAAACYLDLFPRDKFGGISLAFSPETWIYPLRYLDMPVECNITWGFTNISDIERISACNYPHKYYSYRCAEYDGGRVINIATMAPPNSQLVSVHVDSAGQYVTIDVDGRECEYNIKQMGAINIIDHNIVSFITRNSVRANFVFLREWIPQHVTKL